ncbi:MAG: FapA family protein [Treponema sp.]|jgi:uncharacterized protein (DUF342 family)|nr:FapA family protein [Treponema sp.]
MVDFVQLQEILKHRLEQDRAIHIIEVTGSTLEAATADAAALLDIPVRLLEYEIVERGSSGMLGMGKKEWRIQAYEKVTAKAKKHGEGLLEEELGEQAPVIEDRDGEAFVYFSSDGEAMLKVTAPSGNGRKAAETYAVQLLRDRHAENIDTGLVSKIVREAQGTYIKVGGYERHSYNDSVVRTEISEGEMYAYMQVTPPGEGGSDVSFETFISVFKGSRIVHGVKEDVLRNFIDKPDYNEKVEIAVGTKALDGKDAYMQYFFETDQSKVRLKEGSNGKIDFKELNIIQNVTENQPLAKKIPPEKGIPGETVTGKWLTASNGKDISLPIGSNVHASDDDSDTILSDMNGQVIVAGGLVNVEPVYTVAGDVNLKTGNIIFLGTVVVQGNIEDGFSIKASGNIEVHGTVAKADLDAEGDIIIYQGVNGKGEGHIQAGKSLWARFIENANITVGDMVFVSDGIINSYVDAHNRIICQGKRASIMGGRLRACEEINAKVLGNPTSGTETICEVGFDPKLKEELDKLHKVKSDLDKQLEEVNRNVLSLTNIKKQRKSLPDDKEAFLQEQTESRNALMKELQKTHEKIQEIQTILNSLKARGRVSASTKVYPGVKVMVRDVMEEVRTEYKAVTFVMENGLIKMTKYEEPDESAKKGPDGYTTN